MDPMKKLEANEIAPITKGLGALGCANVHSDGLVNIARLPEGRICMQNNETDLLSVERQFFSALIRNQNALDHLMSDDSLLIDVLSGSEVTKSELLDVLKSGQLRFEDIAPLNSRVRFYNGTAIITGSTKMTGHFGKYQFSVHSKYTHVYVKAVHGWQLVSAQGTQMSGHEVNSNSWMVVHCSPVV